MQKNLKNLRHSSSYNTGIRCGKTLRKYIPLGATVYDSIEEAIRQTKNFLELESLGEVEHEYFLGKLKSLQTEDGN